MADSVEKTVKDMVGKMNIGEDLGLGADGTPTKLIDDAAEKTCIQMLKKKNENFNILSEEAGFIDNKAYYTLVMDPIDGTHNAIRGIPFYSLSLALGRSKLSDVEYGLVRNLVTGDTYWAERGKGAFFNDKSIATRSYPKMDSMFSIYIGQRSTKRTHEIVKIPRRGRALGCASLEMCLVAQGALDVYYHNYSPIEYGMRVTDIAASTLILREAKGEVFNDTYDILEMNFDIKSRTNVIAVGDKSAITLLTEIEREKQVYEV